MQILKKFEDPELIKGLSKRIAKLATEKEQYTFMEVCGTHTHEIGKWALKSLLPDNIRLVSGPGCPVCVTPGEYIDNAYDLAMNHDVIVCTFGDMIRVPGHKHSLEKAKSEGGNVHLVYSPFEVIDIAKSTDKEVVFLAVGFETTISGIAVTINEAVNQGLKNLSFYNSFKLVPPALAALGSDPEISLDGLILPGHVSVIIGINPYNIIKTVDISGVVAGFEPVDIMQAIEALIKHVNSNEVVVENLYSRAVKPEGNKIVLDLFEKLFVEADAIWRGIGNIPLSGYELKDEYESYDAAKRFDLKPLSDKVVSGCSCGQVLKGLITPPECPLFGKTCNVAHPVGPCMVSSEGTCAAYYKYGQI